MIHAVIFDMDGVLIDSEPFWVESEIMVFKKYGIALTKEMSVQTMGKRVDEVVAYWFDKFPHDDISQGIVAKEVIEHVIRLVKEKGKEKNGVREILQFFSEKSLPIAIASSSAMQIIEAVVEKLGIREYFSVLSSAEHEPFGKPHPGVFLTTAKKLGVDPSDCLVFEDSPNGVLAAKAAGMTCIAIPDKTVHTASQFGKADIVWSSLADFAHVSF